MTIKFKNAYENKRNEKFFTKIDYEDDPTDQSQIIGASMREMAKKFGIDALIAKAEQTMINESLQNELYGNDYTNMFTSKEHLLNVKKNVHNLFERIPARIRKEIFNDNVQEFLDAYTTNDENKLTTLNKYGIVSDSQLNAVKQYNINKAKELKEIQTKNSFITK